MQWLIIFNMQWKLWREVHHHSHLNTLISQLGISKMLWLNHVNVPNVDACCHVLLMNIARVSLMTLSRYNFSLDQFVFLFFLGARLNIYNVFFTSEFLELQSLMAPTSRELQLLLHESDRKVLWIFRYMHVIYALIVTRALNDKVNFVQNVIIPNKTLNNIYDVVTFVIKLWEKGSQRKIKRMKEKCLIIGDDCAVILVPFF